MRTLAVSIAAMLALVVLAGCSDAPPSGELSITSRDIDAEGTATVTYQSFQDPLGVATGPDDPACGRPVPEVPQCQDPYTSVEVHFMPGGLSAGDPSVPYTAYFTNASGDLEIGALQVDAAGMATAMNNFTADLGGLYDAIEVRMGGVAVATAGVQGGSPNNFAVAPDVTGVSGQGTFDGRTLEVELSGIPEGAEAVGWLVQNDEEGGEEHVVSFQVANGPNTYEAEGDIADYDAFHVHLGGSKVNLGIAPIEA